MEQAIYLGTVIGSPLHRGFTLGGILYYTTSGTFDKTDYPGLRAVCVHCQGGGGSGAGASSTVANQGSFGNGGDGGDYARSLILATDLADSEAVTVGAGGATATGAAGNDGGDSIFDTISGEVRGAGGLGGGLAPASTSNTHGSRTTPTGAGSVGDLIIPGGPAGAGWRIPSIISEGGAGGDSVLGHGAADRAQNLNGFAGNGYGAGGNGTANGPSQSARTSGEGTDGIVIVELLY